MYRGRKQKFDRAFAVKVGDFAAVALSFPIAFFVWSIFASTGGEIEATHVTWLNCLFYGFLVLVFLDRYGLYSWASFIRSGRAARRLPLALLTSLVVFVVVRFLVSASPQLPEIPFLLAHIAILYVLMNAAHFAVRQIVTHGADGISHERIAFMGWSPRLEAVLKGLRDEMGQYQIVVGFLGDELHPENEAPEKFGFKCLGPASDIKQIIEDHDISLVLVDQSKVTWRVLRSIAAASSDAMVNLRMIPNVFEIWTNRLNVRIVSGVPVLGINNLQHDRFGNRSLKRGMDIVGAIVGLILSAPIMGILAIIIYRESPGPIFFRQVRLGQGGKPFKIIKLRSMKLNAESETGAVWAVGDDPRRLKIGTFMRSTNLDELPQFWNVLVGEMSLVGPRPERPEFVKDFRDSVRYYNLRHTLKPGVTGWAAVHGLRGDTSLEDRLEYDLYYIENWSLPLDVRILFMTLAPPKNAY